MTSRAWLVAPAICAAGVALFVTLVALDSPLRVPVSLVWSPAILAIASLSAARLAASPELATPWRAAWGALAVANALTAAGDAVWAWYAWGGQEPPLPSLADPLYLAAYPCWLVGLLLMPVARVTAGERIRLVLDLGTVLLGSVIVVGHLFFDAALAVPAVDLASRVAVLGPPIGDVVVIAVIASVLLREPTPSMRVPLLTLLGGLLTTVVADLAYAVWGAEGSYSSASPIDALWMTGNCLSVLAAWWPRTERDGGPAARVAWDGVAQAFPTLGMLLGFAVLVRLAATGGEPQTSLAVEAGLLCGLVALRQAHLRSQNERLHAEIAHQFARSEALLLNILPVRIAARLKERPQDVIADHVDDATVLFADIVGFTPLAANTPADQLLAVLDDVFSRFDALADTHGLEKIKTIGDAYMTVCGVPDARDDHADRTVAMGLAMLEALGAVNRERGLSLQLRIGVHSGPLTAGVIGRRKFSYDLWGDTVNTASRMESHGVPGRVHLSDATRRRLTRAFALEPRGPIEVKGKGTMETWVLARTAT
jgi:class 3 adenylate cyclase